MENACPLFIMGYFANGEGLPVSNICCIGEGCRLWDEENECCSIKSVSMELRHLREQLDKMAKI